MANPKNKITASTQAHLDIDDITDNLVILKSGHIVMVLATTSVNFDILSEAEQDATIYAYAAFLNSLSFPLEVMIHSKKADITAYYQHLEQFFQEQPNPDLKRQIQKYMEFIQATVQQKTILDKQFYMTITFSPLELGLKGIKKQPSQPQTKVQLLKDAKVQLLPKRDHIIKQTARIGLLSRQLATKELIELFYEIYNPAPAGTQSIEIDSAGYSQPLVKPAVESPAPADTLNQQQSPSGSKASIRPIVPGNIMPNPTESSPQQNTSQKDALKSLQESSSKAKQFIEKQNSYYQQSQQVKGEVPPPNLVQQSIDAPPGSKPNPLLTSSGQQNPLGPNPTGSPTQRFMQAQTNANPAKSGFRQSVVNQFVSPKKEWPHQLNN